MTVTTRSKRPGEVHGVNYYFVSLEEFRKLQRQGAHLEWAVVHGNHYGTPLSEVREPLRRGKDVLLKSDVQGAAKVKERVPDAVFIFVAPPSLDELMQRLMARGTESPEEQRHRLREACQEMRHLPAYDYVVLNQSGKVDEAVERIKCFVTAEKSRVRPRWVEL